MYGIYCGKDANVAVIEDCRISFLRIREDHIIALFTHGENGTVGIVLGYGKDHNANAAYCLKNVWTGGYLHNDATAVEELNKHAGDELTFGENGELAYRMYDGTVFDLNLAEPIDMRLFERPDRNDPTLTLPGKMAKWNIRKWTEFSDDSVNVGINTEKYSILFSVFAPWRIYCRVGINGYCEKGWAMLSTTCIRQNECRMISDNRNSANDYRPDENCFVADGCAFPRDGGWYWSLKSATDDVIYFNGCGGATYEIHRQ